ncbi:MAG TPA: type I methionyl aminopeptidase [Candidatus Saccharimonadales bacterium]|nr:type I methionyl aminopeptidase [Candidatus Saccharimonadales bacterium]
MSQIKTREEIELMKVSGKVAAKALKKILENIKPGVKAIELDTLAKEVMEAEGATASFPTVEDYKWATCITFNEQVVHGIPTQRELKDGDIVSIDTGALYKGYHSDMAITFPVGKISQETEKFLKVGEKALDLAISKAKAGNTIGDVSQALQETIEGAGYSIVKNLTGHGIGTELHEEPMVPGFGKAGIGPKIKEGMTLAIEAIYAQKSGKVYLEDDGWTITTQDGSLGGLFEKTIVVTKGGPIVLTPYL